ncbi:DUF3500 domain-containing protein [Chitinophaga pollutisoli]|uniref:DUF3500 domain-containing protein n=1 Tax=Chitinophaga pollutisoli TaxID=3133966 RepID=A0ABZ2YGZ9_9BACT
MKTLFLPACLILASICPDVFSQSKLPAKTAAPQTLEQAAQSLFFDLGREKLGKMTAPFEGDQRFDWHFVPKERYGLRLKDMTLSQQERAFALMNLCLSNEGARKAKGVVELEAILREVEKRAITDTYRDTGNFYFAVFGSPFAGKPWALRMEGHHVSLNFTILNNRILSVGPGFLGANPARVPSGPAMGHQLLKQETELAFSLMNGLSEQQRKIAVVADKAPSDIITGNKRRAWQLDPPGIAWSALKPAQHRQLRSLIDVYIGRYTRLMHDILWKEIEASGLDSIHFAWAGGRVWGEGHYYRIQGPTFLIEYDNTQNDANHVHSVFRELKNDFGEDALQQHYNASHQ